MMRNLPVYLLLSLSLISCRQPVDHDYSSNQNAQVTVKPTASSAPVETAEPIEYAPFSYRTDQGTEISAKVVADQKNRERRIVVLSPPIENSPESLSEAAFNAMKNWRPPEHPALAFGTARQENDSSDMPVTCWEVGKGKRRFCSLPNPPIEDGTINVMRVWWK